ncbi:MAG: amidase [Thermoleophilia bacterium]|nr:amidase [Gaiellaceae bacterium]MDW8338944.1 amidase [Thermoleophilia bacterium]
MDLVFLPATEQARLLRIREISSEQLVRTYLERIERIDPHLNAYVTVRAEEALAEARLADRTSGEAPFHGVPIAIKDLSATAGIRTTFSSRAFADYVPDFDVAVVRRIREAGFVLLGKTNTSELGTTAFTESELNGATRNPWNPERTPGGSSGGAAAALAAGLTPIAHGSDGGGSIRIPASCCGVVGLKPSRGRVSSAPFTSLEGLATSGPIARTVADAAALLDVMAGYEPGDPWWAPPPERPFAEEAVRPPGRLRVAATSEPPFPTPIARECRAALEGAAALLDDLGHEVHEETPPWREPDLMHAFLTVWQVAPALHPIDDPALLTPLNRELLRAARACSAAGYARAAASLGAYARRVVAFWEDVDVVLTPTLALPPVPIGWQETAAGAFEQLLRNAEFTPFTAVANVTGQPALSLPLAWTSDGLPIGVHAIGPPAGDALLLRLAAQVEEARPWAQHRPPLAELPLRRAE